MRLFLCFFQHQGRAAGQVQLDPRHLGMLPGGDIGLMVDPALAAEAVIVGGEDHLIIPCLGHGDPISLVRLLGVEIKYENGIALLIGQHLVPIVQQKLPVCAA